MTVEPMHFDCVICQVRADDEHSAEMHAAAILVTLTRAIVTLDQMRSDLCFAHRRVVDGAVVELEAESEASA